MESVDTALINTNVPTTPTAIDLDKIFGDAILFVFPDVGWSVQQFVDLAKFARSLGYDTISPKIGEGTQPWYSLDAVKQQRQAVLNSGCGYAPFWYCLAGSRWPGIVPPQCDLLKQYGDVNDHIIIADMEAEWNGQVGLANTFNSLMRPWSGILGVTTWADPAYQNWLGVAAAIAPCTNFWIPQRYDMWLAAQPVPPEETIIQPGLDLSQEFGPNNVVSLAMQAASRNQPAWIWDNFYVQRNPALAREVATILKRA